MRKVLDITRRQNVPRASLALACGVVCVLACVAAASAQTRGWVWQNPLPQGNAINAVRFAADKRHGWAVGGDGVVLRSDDGGFDWESQQSPAKTTLYGLFVKDKKSAVAVGARGAVVTTDDGGERWALRETGVKDHLAAGGVAGAAFKPSWGGGPLGRLLAPGGRRRPR